MEKKTLTDRENEWTVVPRGKGRGTKPAPQAPRTDEDITLENLIERYKHRRQIWRASTSRRALVQILDQKQPDDGWQIKQAIIFGSGSFCRDNWEWQRRSMTQFVAFMDIVEHLQASNETKIDIVAQELEYAPLDVEFLSQMSVRAPPASNPIQPTEYRLDCDSFVFEPFLVKSLETMGPLLRSDARLFIGTAGPGPESGSRQALDEIRPLYEKFESNYAHYKFPTFEEDMGTFEGLQIYWKNESETD